MRCLYYTILLLGVCVCQDTCPDNQKWCPDEGCKPLLHSCTRVCSQFEQRCPDGTCISKGSRCDVCKTGERRCWDGTCRALNIKCASHCSIYQKECDDGRCVDRTSHCQYQYGSPPSRVSIARRHENMYRFGLPVLTMLVIFLLLYVQYKRRKLMVENAIGQAGIAPSGPSRPVPAIGYLPILANCQASRDPNAPPSYYASSRAPANTVAPEEAPAYIPAAAPISAPAYSAANACEGSGRPPPYPGAASINMAAESQDVPPPPSYDDIIKTKNT